MADDIDNVDIETSILIVRISLDDIEEDQHNYGHNSDEAIALRVQAENLQSMLDTLESLRLARSLSEALRRDAQLIERLAVVHRGEEEDHACAVALQGGQPLPPQSNSQRSLEDPNFLNARPAEPEEMEREANVDAEEPWTVDDLTTAMGEVDLVRVSTDPFERAGRPLRIDCIICGDAIRNNRLSMTAPCSHDYCRECLTDLVRACIGDESLYPLRCCQRNLENEEVYPLLPRALLEQFRTKSLEFGTPAASRLYCPNPACSAFLGSTTDTDETIVTCEKCGDNACTQCKQAAHAGEGCGESEMLQAVKELARTERWQTCPECNAIIELAHGCYHMTCRCRSQFCYLCAVPWKNCTCPQWDEGRLLDTAQQRVRDELGRRAVQMAPQVLQERIHERVQQLRHDHDCIAHSWRRRNGGGQCSECYHYLREFLLVCRNCSLLACVRCSRNRL